MRTYETTFIISGAASEGNREAIIARYEKMLTDNGADFKRVVRWGKRQLAYSIKKQQRGYYVIYYYDADPSIINPMHREMDLNELVLRYMTLVSDGIHPEYIRDEGEPEDVVPVEPETITSEADDAADDAPESAEEAEAAPADETEDAADDTDAAEEAADEDVAQEKTEEAADAATSEEPAEEADADDDAKEVE